MSQQIESVSSLLEELNSVTTTSTKPIKKILELPLNTPMKVLNLSRFTSRFGNAVAVELQDCRIVLPKRYTDILSEQRLKVLKQENNLTIVITGYKQFQGNISTPEISFSAISGDSKQ